MMAAMDPRVTWPDSQPASLAAGLTAENARRSTRHDTGGAGVRDQPGALSTSSPQPLYTLTHADGR